MNNIGKKGKKGKLVWVEVSDYAEELITHGEYFKKKPETPMFKYRLARIVFEN